MKHLMNERQRDGSDKWSASDDSHFRRHFEEQVQRSAVLGRPLNANAGDWVYDDVRPAYQLGLRAGRDLANAGRSYADVAAELERVWESKATAAVVAWKRARPLVRAAFEHGVRSRGAADSERAD
ncbi:MAG: hypothetical protein ABJD07_04105 [Gemmatimonadaceae bacterium]